MRVCKERGKERVCPWGVVEITCLQNAIWNSLKERTGHDCTMLTGARFLEEAFVARVIALTRIAIMIIDARAKIPLAGTKAKSLCPRGYIFGHYARAIIISLRNPRGCNSAGQE